MALRKWKIVNLIIPILLVGYFVVTARYCSTREQELRCSGVDIQVADSAMYGFVTPATILRMITDSSITYNGVPLTDVDLYAVERCIALNPYVSSADAYTSIDGLLHVRLNQRHPKLRVVSEQGHNFYVDSTLRLMPPSAEYIAQVPVVSGSPVPALPIDKFGEIDEKKFIKERELLYNLINFVHQVDSDTLLSALVVQIYIQSDAEAILLPRLGGQIIRFGAIGTDDQDSKLRKLVHFYRQSFGHGWWATTSEVDLRYRDQVVCKQRKRPAGTPPVVPD